MINFNFTPNLNTSPSGYGRSQDPSWRRENADAARGRRAGGGRSERPRSRPGREGEDPQDQGHARQSTILRMYATAN